MKYKFLSDPEKLICLKLIYNFNFFPAKHPTIRVVNSTKVTNSRDKTIEVTDRNLRDEDEAWRLSAFYLSVIFLLGEGCSEKRKPTEPVGHHKLDHLSRFSTLMLRQIIFLVFFRSNCEYPCLNQERRNFEISIYENTGSSEGKR